MPPASAAALQPPVPGQSSGSGPSFSYNLLSQPNVSSASGQQLQAGTVRLICFLLGSSYIYYTNAIFNVRENAIAFFSRIILVIDYIYIFLLILIDFLLLVLASIW